MGGIFAAALKEDCVFDLFFGTDYHSHLGTRRAGMVVYGEDGFDRAIHNIENSPFRTKFEHDVQKMHGNMGVGCISDFEPQPLITRSHHGTFAITTVGKINNLNQLADHILANRGTQFQEMSGGSINPTELVAALSNEKDNVIDGIRYAQEIIDGSLTMMILTDRGIFRQLGPGEIAIMTPDGVTTLSAPGPKMRICTFLWVYYGYPSASYENVSVEAMRVRCGQRLARRDKLTKNEIDSVAGVPDSGIAHAIGYANESGVPFSRPFIKYTPTWPRSFMPTIQSKRDLIAKMKLIPVRELIEGQRLLLIDDSIVRGTQLRETTEFLYRSGAKEVHVRPACPPILFGCKYINFSRSNSDMELIARRVIREFEGDDVPREVLEEYADPDSERYAKMLDRICEQLGFTSLRYNRLDDMIDAVGLPREKLCTYCWDGRE